MLTNESFMAAVDEVAFLRQEIHELFEPLEKINLQLPEELRPTHRLVTVPIIYAAWERAFCNGSAILLKIIVQSNSTYGELGNPKSSFFLLKESFFTSSMAKAQDERCSVRELEKFTNSYKEWLNLKPSSTTNVDEIIITKSNVDQKVIEINDQLLGFSSCLKYSQLNLKAINELVGRRNDIGHGSSLRPPGEKEFQELFDTTKANIETFLDIIVERTAALNKGSSLSGTTSVLTDILATLKSLFTRT